MTAMIRSTVVLTPFSGLDPHVWSRCFDWLMDNQRYFWYTRYTKHGMEKLLYNCRICHFISWAVCLFYRIYKISFPPYSLVFLFFCFTASHHYHHPVSYYLNYGRIHKICSHNTTVADTFKSGTDRYQQTCWFGVTLIQSI
jgi:hypothetical protein